MKKRTFVLSKKAISDIEEIWLYTVKKWSVEQADRYYNLIYDEIDFIRNHEDAGKSLENVRQGYRSSKVKSHLIFFKISGSHEIEIVRVLHERMDIENRLKE